MLSSAPARRGPILTSIRTRVVAWFVFLLALATVGSVLVARQILLNRLDQRIDQELVRESRELRILARDEIPRPESPSVVLSRESSKSSWNEISPHRTRR